MAVAFPGARVDFVKCRLVNPLHSQGTPQSADEKSDPAKPYEPHEKRILGIIPNFRTFPLLSTYKPLTTKEKFKIARDDSFDRGTIILGAAFGGFGQLTHSEPSFGQGVDGYAQYFATSYAGFVIGDYMTEAIFPTLLHQDPRYFRRGMGSGWSRTVYAMKQIFWTRTDAGGSQFNYSEIAGNATAVAISTAYYPDGRDAGDAVVGMGTQIGVDMASNILKEFWPDLHRKLSPKARSVPSGSGSLSLRF